MKYTDKIPTETGWYWQRKDGNERILYVHNLRFIAHWKQLKAECLEVAKTYKTKSEVLELKALPESAWKIEWAGPLKSPE